MSEAKSDLTDGLSVLVDKWRRLQLEVYDLAQKAGERSPLYREYMTEYTAFKKCADELCGEIRKHR